MLRIEQQHAEYAWTVMDADGNGYLGYAEVLMAVTDFIMSTEPEAVGNRALDRI